MCCGILLIILLIIIIIIVYIISLFILYYFFINFRRMLLLPNTDVCLLPRSSNSEICPLGSPHNNFYIFMSIMYNRIIFIHTIYNTANIITLYKIMFFYNFIIISDYFIIIINVTPIV